MDKQQLKARVAEALRARRADIEAVAKSIFAEPELGYKEVKTSAKVKALFDDLGLEYTEGWGLTGVKARMKGKGSKRTVAMVGELDAIVCRGHEAADPVTGAAHCCGHNIQIANMAAVAMALKDAGAMEYLGGDVVVFAVPAEEYVEIDYRSGLRADGKIRYLGGKQQIIAEGGFDDVDMAMQMHVDVKREEGNFACGGSCNGFIGKLIEYRGRAAHAAAAPDRGINALNACMLGVMGVNALRERFREEDVVRFHPIINSGGDLVNVVPDHVTMESYVRASNVNALKNYNEDINRALKAGAMALGAEAEIEDIPGYLPLRPDLAFRGILEENAKAVFGEKQVSPGEHSAGSTDMGDVSHLMPVVHPWIGCVDGVLHGANYVLSDPDAAYEKIPEVLASTIIDLLWDDAAAADKICREFKPVFTKKTYCAFMDGIAKKE